MNIIEYLKRPELVIKVQEYFGIKYLRTTASSQSIRKVKNKNDSPSKQNKSNGNITNFETKDSNLPSNDYIIGNKFWYYLFLLGTELGDEIFYGTFIPFWFWNIDGAVGRRFVFLWTLVMYCGQSLKDIIRWPRPKYPVAKLQQKWGLEYGMPSTHAMIAVSIPFSILIFTHQRYQFPFLVGLVIAIIWCSVICLSRIYLGMHSVCDVVAGILLTIILMMFLVPLVDYIDIYILTFKYSPLIILFISIMLIVYYPCSDKWTPTRNDTVMVISFCAGLQIGAWINYQLGYMVPTILLSPPYKIIWPTYSMIGLLILRTILGICSVVATIAIGKFLSYGFVCALLGKDKNELHNSENHLNNKDKITVELSYKYFTYGLVGLSTQYLLPNVFKLLNIGRPDFYTEI